MIVVLSLSRRSAEGHALPGGCGGSRTHPAFCPAPHLSPPAETPAPPRYLSLFYIEKRALRPAASRGGSVGPAQGTGIAADNLLHLLRLAFHILNQLQLGAAAVKVMPLAVDLEIHVPVKVVG